MRTQHHLELLYALAIEELQIVEEEQFRRLGSVAKYVSFCRSLTFGACISAIFQ